MSPIRRLAVAACWLAVLTAYVAAVVPPRDAPHLGGSDKVDHMAAFFTISFFARLAYRRVPGGLLFLLATGFGALIELTQALPFVHRDAQLSDLAADAVAALIGLGAGWPVVAWWGRWEREEG